MNYEIKAVRPASVFANAVRVFIIVGFIAAVYSFFISPYSGIRLAAWWQKILATLLFTGVYALVVSMILWCIARLYDAYILEFDARSLLMYNVATFFAPGICILGAKFLSALSGGFFSALGTSILVSLFFIIAGALGTTALIVMWHAIFGPSQGISVDLEQTPPEP